MKLLLIFLILFCLLPPVFALEQGIGSDKIGHFWFSFLTTQVVCRQNISEAKSTAYVLGLGIIKELWDTITKKEFSGPDLLFNLAGIFLGTAVKL